MRARRDSGAHVVGVDIHVVDVGAHVADVDAHVIGCRGRCPPAPALVSTVILLLLLAVAAAVDGDAGRSSPTLSAMQLLRRPPRYDRQSRDVGTRVTRQDADERFVCQSMDVRNNLKDIIRFKDCEIIEGALRLIMINVSGLGNLTFPKLKEVTHYVMLYRIQDLRTMADLFPNLAVIRGHRLFDEFALILYENHQLHSIGLLGLRHILRGNVRVEKNGLLCFVRTVDWTQLTGRSDAVIQDNKEPSLEPHDDKKPPRIDQMCTMEECPDVCDSFTRQGVRRRACWDHQHCQLRSDATRDCHELCVGGCTRPFSTRHCVACQHVYFRGECMRFCPSDTYLFEGWRCIQRDQCISRKVPEDDQVYQGQTSTQWYKAFNGSCLAECPTKYVPTEDQRSCTKCLDACPKVCGSGPIDSAARVQKMKGCTIIDGGLHVQVSGENIVRELEENLSGIRVIRGYLRVSYSEPLVSLHFLRNLERIEGRKLHNGYALFFLHNQNLQTLWPNTTDVKVDRGRAFFHFNHKLCLDKINSLVERLGITTEDKIDIGQYTNGDKVPCRRKVLHSHVRKVSTHYAVISWTSSRSEVTDFRTLVGYNLFYREAPHRNVSQFGGRNACGEDVWQVLDYTNINSSAVEILEIIHGLKPFTQYAYYVETLMANTGINATMAQSNVIYFTTTPTNPSLPRMLHVNTLSDSSLQVQYHQPLQPNGIVTHYRVISRVNPEPVPYRSETCKEILGLRPIVTIQPPKPDPPSSGGNRTQSAIAPDGRPGCCTCGDGSDGQLNEGGPLHESDSEKLKRIQDQILFEDKLQNFVFTKKFSGAGERSRRSIEVNGMTDNTVDDDRDTYREPCHQNTTLPNEYCMEFDDIYEAQLEQPNTVVLSNLRYFTEYTVEVMACQAPPGDPRQPRLCSQSAIASQQTSPNDTADSIPEPLAITNATAGGLVTLTWLDPPAPNGGVVLSYTISYHRVDDQQPTTPTKVPVCPVERCATPPCHRHQQIHLPIGNISLRVQARTLAGLGKLSAPLYHVVTPSSSQLPPEAIAAIVVGLMLLLLLVALSVFFCMRRHAKQQLNAIYTSWNPYYGGLVTTPYVSDEWEVEIGKVHFDHIIGKGSFGSVYFGTAELRPHDEPDEPEKLRQVAIKTLLDDATVYDRQAFLCEASLMKDFDCFHVVRLMGIVSNMNMTPEPGVPAPPYVIMELMTKGDLKSYLRSMRPDDDGVSVPSDIVVMPDIYLMAVQIADGMAYLSDVNSVHRDLAARNCMVTDNTIIKIGDFGMTRHLYEKDYYKKGGKGLLPVRWMGPESLRDGLFTSQSDIWSYGVVLWEMATYAAQPYQGLSNEEVITHVLNRNRMIQPAGCPDLLFQMMLRCWEYRPTDRPTFLQLVDELLPHASATFLERSFYSSGQRRRRSRSNVSATAATTAAASGERVTPPAASRPAVLRPLMAQSEDLSSGEEDGGGGGGEELDVEVDASVPSVKMRRGTGGGGRRSEEPNYTEFDGRPAGGANSVASSADNSRAFSVQLSSSEGSKASNGSVRNGSALSTAAEPSRTALL